MGKPSQVNRANHNHTRRSKSPKLGWLRSCWNRVYLFRVGASGWQTRLHKAIRQMGGRHSFLFRTTRRVYSVWGVARADGDTHIQRWWFTLFERVLWEIPRFTFLRNPNTKWTNLIMTPRRRLPRPFQAVQQLSLSRKLISQSLPLWWALLVLFRVCWRWFITVKKSIASNDSKKAS